MSIFVCLHILSLMNLSECIELNRLKLKYIIWNKFMHHYVHFCFSFEMVFSSISQGDLNNQKHFLDAQSIQSLEIYTPVLSFCIQKHKLSSKTTEHNKSDSKSYTYLLIKVQSRWFDVFLQEFHSCNLKIEFKVLCRKIMFNYHSYECSC